MKRPQKAKPAKSPIDRDRCRECPLFAPMYDWQGNDIGAPVFDANGQPVSKDGVQAQWRHKDGKLVRWGMCGAELPRRDVTKDAAGIERVGASMRETRSDWLCESKEKHDSIARLAARGAMQGTPHGPVTRK